LPRRPRRDAALPFAETRRLRDDERGAAAVIIGDVRALDQAGHHVWVHRDGPAEGLALWADFGGGVAELVHVSVPPAAPRRRLWRLAGACAEDALARGVTTGRVRFLSRALVDIVVATFPVRVEPAGWDPRAGDPVEWLLEIDVARALELLRAVA
jgi:hypothetical protein